MKYFIKWLLLYSNGCSASYIKFMYRLTHTLVYTSENARAAASCLRCRMCRSYSVSFAFADTLWGGTITAAVFSILNHPRVAKHVY